MNKTTLVILAAGMGSRYGVGIKQLEKVGPNGEIILEYSLYDAIEAGFDKVIFVIRRELREAFDEIIRPEIKAKIEIEYAYQELDAVPKGHTCPPDRKKPWGTGHAVMVAAEGIDGPYGVINADDFYGKNSFKVLHDYLANLDCSAKVMQFCMVGFHITNTLSENGTVKRGRCFVDEQSTLTGIREMYDVQMIDGTIRARYEEGDFFELPSDTTVSMSMFGFAPGFYKELYTRFVSFFEDENVDLLKSELNLPTAVDVAIKEGKARVKVLKTSDSWFGVTYHDDRESVVASLKKLHDRGVYPEKLF